jgi:hypothetical protein
VIFHKQRCLYNLVLHLKLSTVNKQTTSSLQSGSATQVFTRSSQKQELDSAIVTLQDAKFNKTGGSLSGDVTLDSYLNFGSNKQSL